MIPSLIELLINISTQSNFDLAKYNKILCFFFLSVVSCCNFIFILKEKENNKENTEVIKPNNFLWPLTCAKILVDEKTVKTTLIFY